MSYMDNFSKEELLQIVSECTSMRELARRCGYVSIGNNDHTIKRKLAEYGISIEHFTGLSKGQTVRTDDNVFCVNSTASQATLRRHYIQKFPQEKCAICGQSTIWNGKPLSLTLDHINGDNHDNRLENLRWICPNCDRQLPTFAGRNPSKHVQFNEQIDYKPTRVSEVTSTSKSNFTTCKKCGKIISAHTKTQQCPDCYNLSSRTVERPDREQLKDMIRSTPFTTIAAQFGVTDNAIRKWCDQYNLPRKKSDIKNYSDQEWEMV